MGVNEKPCSDMQFIKSRIFTTSHMRIHISTASPHENPYQYYKSHENPYQYYKSRENPYQVLQVTCAASDRAIKLTIK